MKDIYYKLPLQLDRVIRKQSAATCLLKDSVAQHLHLIISTYQGESGFSQAFGCSLWDEEFNIQGRRHWKDQVCDSIKTAILIFEKRLQPEDVSAFIEERKEDLRIRRCLHIHIKGIIRLTNEPFFFRDIIFISPLAQR